MNLLSRITRKRVPAAVACQAAEWWAARIDGIPSADNGDERQSTFLAFHQTVRKVDLTEAQREAFTKRLAQVIRREDVNYIGYMAIRFDYDFDDSIGEALLAAGLELKQFAYNFPIKTTMYVTPTGIVVDEGRGGIATVIASSDLAADEGFARRYSRAA